MKIDLNRICETHGAILSKAAPWVDGELLLKAIAHVETLEGLYNVPKYEKAYDLGGIYANKLLWSKYGALAACSFSSWQIMYQVAYDLGFCGAPIDLSCDATAIYWVMEYIQKRILDKGATCLENIFDAYNSGSFKDGVIPSDYIKKSMDAYSRLHVEKYGG